VKSVTSRNCNVCSLLTGLTAHQATNCVGFIRVGIHSGAVSLWHSARLRLRTGCPGNPQQRVCGGYKTERYHWSFLPLSHASRCRPRRSPQPSPTHLLSIRPAAAHPLFFATSNNRTPILSGSVTIYLSRKNIIPQNGHGNMLC
jgi:hypothetical protein